MAKKRSPERGPQDENVYRVRHISRAAWEEGSVSLPGLPQDAQYTAPPQFGDSVLSSLDRLDDSMVEMAMTQEISLELIREYLRKEEEQAKQRQLEKSRQRQPLPPPAGYGSIRPEEIEGYQAPGSRPAQKQPEPKQPQKKRAQIPRPTRTPQEKARALPKPKPEIAEEPFIKPKAQPKPKPKAQPKAQPEKVEAAPEKSRKAKSEKKSVSKPARTVAKTAFDNFWNDELALYYVPLRDVFDYMYRNIYYFGLRFARPILFATRYALPYLLHPILALWHLSRAVIMAVQHVTIGRVRRRTAAGKKKHAKRLAARAAFGSKPTPFIALKEFAADYRTILSSVVNTLLPVFALGVMALVIRMTAQQTYALQVDYNGSNLGYIASENVYLSAQAAANQHIAPKPVDDLLDTENSLKTSAQYQLVRVGPEQLTSADRLTDELLSNATDPMTSACGVYIADADGGNSRLVATTKNSTDANWVLETLKDEKSKGLTIEKGATIGFVQQVDLVPGFYPESQLTDPDQLLGMLSGNDVGGVPYTLQDGESLWTVAKKFGISYAKLQAMNPEAAANETRLQPGEEILISEEVPVLQLKVVQTERRLIEVSYETITRDNENMFRGTSRTIVKGENGEDEVYERVTYINNVRQSGAIPIGVPRRLKEPVTEVKEVGLKSTVVTIEDGTSVNIKPSNAGFTWPLPDIHVISSYYGNRKGRMHYGIDITNGSAYGHTAVAAMDGVISHVGYTNDGFGYNVVIDHGNGVQTRYAHMINGSCPYSVGRRVSIGQPIGRVGSTGNSTGPHLHFEVIINGRRVNPLNYVSR